MSIKGKLSFACQETWIFSGNILQNILFGSLYEMNRYDNVVRVCGLEDDLKQLPHGDKTIVGERGVTLSVGQKARYVQKGKLNFSHLKQHFPYIS